MKLTHGAKTVFSIIFAGLVFFAGAYLYLTAATGVTENQMNADAKDMTVPYSPSYPDNAGLLTVFPDNSAALIYLDFSEQRIYTALMDEYTEGVSEYLGYDISHTVFADYSLISGITDRVGGLELELNGEKLRYTGVQITDYLSRTPATNELKRQLISLIFERISKNGFSRDDLVYIIENSDTDLTVPDCFEWPAFISDMALRAVFIN